MKILLVLLYFSAIKFSNCNLSIENSQINHSQNNLEYGENQENWNYDPYFNHEYMEYQQNNNEVLGENEENSETLENDGAKSEKIKLNCPKCDKFFYYKSHVARHIAIVHDKVRPFPCERCSKKFYTKDQLERHIQVGTLQLLTVAYVYFPFHVAN